MALIDPFSTLPTELCLKVISQNFSTDEALMILWTSIRNVSQRWRSLVDDYVRLVYLPKTVISITSIRSTIGVEERHDGGSISRQNQLTARFSFEQLSSCNSTIAIFSDTDDTMVLRGATFCNLLGSTGSLEDLGKDEEGPYWRHPAHIISIGHFANDTALPGVTIDWRNLKLKCDWRAAYTHLLYEEKLRLTLAQKWISGIEAGWRARSKLLDNNSPIPVANETLPHRRRGAWHDNSSREARKRRMLRCAEENGQEIQFAGTDGAKDLTKMQELGKQRVVLDSMDFTDKRLGSSRHRLSSEIDEQPK